MPSKETLLSKPRAPLLSDPTLTMPDNDDDFQNPSLAISLTRNLTLPSSVKPARTHNSQPLKPSNAARLSKKQKRSACRGKENLRVPSVCSQKTGSESNGLCNTLVDFRLSGSTNYYGSKVDNGFSVDGASRECNECLSSEPRLQESSSNCRSGSDNGLFNESGFSNSLNASSDVETGLKSDNDCILTSEKSKLLESSMNCNVRTDDACLNDHFLGIGITSERGEKNRFKVVKNSSNSIESRLLSSRMDCASVVDNIYSGYDDGFRDFEPGTQLDVLLNLCAEISEDENSNGVECHDGHGSSDSLIHCPLCGVDISDLSDEQRQVHTNKCLDGDQVALPLDKIKPQPCQQAMDISPVVEWLRTLDLSKYEEAFIQEEVDWDTLQWLTEEDLISIGVTALGPRKKIVHALDELRKRRTQEEDSPKDYEISLPSGNKRITDYFPGSITDRKKGCMDSKGPHGAAGHHLESSHKRAVARDRIKNGKLRDIPPWCHIPGTPFRVDAFKYLRGDCFHWFLTHFHIDHYQGLTRSFCHGKIYCSSITARLVNMKIGVPWDRLQILPLNQKISIAGIDVTCLDANHCPGSIIVLFEPPNGKAVLHTGDFRYSDEMATMSIWKTCPVHTLILDTTYCNHQYDFPKQEAVIQFVIEAIQAEAFNPKTLFLIGSYTIGKERLFLEVARALHKKVYVGAAKLRLLECLGLPEEDMQWLTINEEESCIHVVPMWTIASFKRMKHISNLYLGRFNLIVAFSPTGWTFGKGKKKSPGRRWQHGTIIRYEVPYSEHCSFSELREFVKFVSPVNIIPSVNNSGPECAAAMITLLTS